MRKLLHFVFTKPLPSESHTLIYTVLGLPGALAASLLTSVNPQGNPTSICSASVCYFALISVISSSLFAGFGYYLPKAIRARTTFVTFILWTLLAAAFSVSAFAYENATGYGASASVAVCMLLLLVVTFLYPAILMELHNVDSEKCEAGALQFLLHVLLYLMMVVCVVTLVTIPLLMFLASLNAGPFICTTSALHLAAFFFWLLVAMLVAPFQEGI